MPLSMAALLKIEVATPALNSVPCAGPVTTVYSSCAWLLALSSNLSRLDVIPPLPPTVTVNGASTTTDGGDVSRGARFQPSTFIRSRSYAETSLTTPGLLLFRYASCPVGSAPPGPLAAQSPRSPLARAGLFQ